MQRKIPVFRMSACAFLVLACAVFQPLGAQNFSGAIFTTAGNGTGVNVNFFESKPLVWLNGGPQNAQGSGLPVGLYFYQVTTPSGGNLSTDMAVCRQVRVDLGSGGKGRIRADLPIVPDPGCLHAAGTPVGSNGSVPVQLIPFADTTNPGGEYKVHLISTNAAIGCGPGVVSIDPGDDTKVVFPAKCSKSDNFKIRPGEVDEHQVLISGVKYYDLDLDGTFDNTEPPVEGFQIRLEILDAQMQVIDTQFTFTGFNGEWGFFIDEGTTFRACEILPPLSPTWIQTGPLVGATSGSAQADAQRCWTGTAAVDTPGLNFWNICLGAGGGKTLGFWSNKNGAKIFNDNGGLAIVNPLNLVNQAGSYIPNFANHDQFKAWLLAANAQNMSYMLSAQMAAMALNATIGGVNGGSNLFAGPEPATCGINGLSAAGIITVNALIADANAELGLDGLTPAGDPERVCQEFKKNALDAGNNNLNFVQITPCAVNYGPGN